MLITEQVRTKILKRLAATRKTVEQLGANRDTPAEQRRYILDISMKFQKLADAALSANYVGCDWFDQYPDLRFATTVVTRNQLFADMLAQHGQSYHFEGHEPQMEMEGDAQEDDNFEYPDSQESGPEPKETVTV